MDLRELAFLARISECNAIVAGMNAANAQWAADNQQPEYIEGHFQEQSQELAIIRAEIEALLHPRP